MLRPQDISQPDLRSCDREPIHIPGSIEPNGVLLVLKEPELTVIQVSANTGELLGIEAQKVLGSHLTRLLEPESFERLRGTIASSDLNGKRRYVANLSAESVAGRWVASIHRHDQALILELEPELADMPQAPGGELCGTLTHALADINVRLPLRPLCQVVATWMRELTGFDRVMVYRFLEDDTGEVIAEDCRADLTPYLGLRYPASDIPAQARRLYLINPLRLKADVNAVRVPLIPALNPLTGQPLDMSHCVLRAMSPVHDEYLRNMGVTASMSVSIVKDARLWGLIACHHTEARKVPYQLRTTCEVLASVFSAHIGAAEEEEKRVRAQRSVEFLKRVSERLLSHTSVSEALLTEGDDLASVIAAAGAAIFVGDEIRLIGKTPGMEDVQRLREWLIDHQQTHLLHTEKIAAEHVPFASFADVAAGVLSARIALRAGDFIVWFRPAALQFVEWAGNPEKPVLDTEGGRRISPRLSFERWRETVGDRSAPWLPHEREFARGLRQIVAEMLLVRRNEEITRLNHELERSNIELDAFAYAASHDLQEPIRTVRAYTQLLSRRSGATLDEQSRELLKVIENSASRMGNLIAALLTYGQVGGSTLRERKPVNLADLLRVATLNLTEAIRASDASLEIDTLPTVRADPDQMSQLFQNLIGNAIKYRRPEEAPRIRISSELQDGFWHISIQDNGQGFSPESSEFIFGAFKRLHGRDVPGTGIGLALCKRIVEHHGGRLWAESPGKGLGATLRFTLPVSE